MLQYVKEYRYSEVENKVEMNIFATQYTVPVHKQSFLLEIK